MNATSILSRIVSILFVPVALILFLASGALSSSTFPVLAAVAANRAFTAINAKKANGSTNQGQKDA